MTVPEPVVLYRHNLYRGQFYNWPVADSTEYFAYPASTDPVPALVAENARLREALGRLSRRHEWSPNFVVPCVCPEHLEARALLSPPAPPVTEAGDGGSNG